MSIGRLLGLILMAFLSGCTSKISPSATPLAQNLAEYRVYYGRKAINLQQLIEATAQADVVLLGEYHTQPGVHQFQADFLWAIHQSLRPYVLSMEQFSRDAQEVVDDYLDGFIGEQPFIKTSGAWANYASDYRPLLEIAKADNAPVIAANAPRPLVHCVAKNGLAWLHNLDADTRALLARDINVAQADYSKGIWKGENKNKAKKLQAAQAIWDDTMAESIIRAHVHQPLPALIIHTVGTFHLQEQGGLIEAIQRRDPKLKIIAINAINDPSHNNEQAYYVQIQALPARHLGSGAQAPKYKSTAKDCSAATIHTKLHNHDQ